MCPFQYCYLLSSGAGLRPSLQPSWSSLIFPFLFVVEVLYGTRYQSGSVSLINVGNGFHCLRSFFFLFSFLTYMLMHYCKSNVKIELRFQFVCMNSHGSLMWRSLPPLGLYIMVFSLLWLSIRLFLLSQLLPSPFIIHSSPLTYTFLREQNGIGWDQFLLFTALCSLYAA